MPEAERIFHIVTEALALPVGAYLIWLGYTKLKKWHKVAVITIGVGNILIDGWLLMRWFR